jgi:hypothetical protein
MLIIPSDVTRSQALCLMIALIAGRRQEDLIIADFPPFTCRALAKIGLVEPVNVQPSYRRRKLVYALTLKGIQHAQKLFDLNPEKVAELYRDYAEVRRSRGLIAPVQPEGK